MGVNTYLQGRFELSNMIDIPYKSYLNIPYLILWGLPLISLLLGFLFGSLPILLSKALPIAEELRDE